MGKREISQNFTVTVNCKSLFGRETGKREFLFALPHHVIFSFFIFEFSIYCKKIYGKVNGWEILRKDDFFFGKMKEFSYFVLTFLKQLNTPFHFFP